MFQADVGSDSNEESFTSSISDWQSTLKLHALSELHKHTCKHMQTYWPKYLAPAFTGHLEYIKTEIFSDPTIFWTSATSAEALTDDFWIDR